MVTAILIFTVPLSAFPQDKTCDGCEEHDPSKAQPNPQNGCIPCVIGIAIGLVILGGCAAKKIVKACKHIDKTNKRRYEEVDPPDAPATNTPPKSLNWQRKSWEPQGTVVTLNLSTNDVQPENITDYAATNSRLRDPLGAPYVGFRYFRYMSTPGPQGPWTTNAYSREWTSTNGVLYHFCTGNGQPYGTNWLSNPQENQEFDLQMPPLCSGTDAMRFFKVQMVEHVE